MFNLKYRIKRTRTWLRRLTHSKGNGVQSPFAYSFICEVIGNTTAYYAYQDLKSELKAMRLRERKQAKLLLRLANWSQPACVWLPEGYERFAPLLRCGCQRAQHRVYSNQAELAEMPKDKPQFIILPSTESALEGIPEGLADKSVILLFNIRANKQARLQWSQIHAQSPRVLSFDLYDLGLLLVRPRFEKQHYIVNF